MFPYNVGEPLVTIDNVSVTLGGKLILSNVNATIPNITRTDQVQGQIVCLVGPSGCGKTTLFRTIAGLLDPDTGSVTLGASKKPVEPGQVGVVAQHYPLMQYRTVKDNLVYAGLRAGMTLSESRATATEYLSEFNLAEHADKFPSALSGGQRQRAAISQQLICSNHFIVLDEPFSGLDEVAKTKVIKLLIKVANKHDDNTLIIIRVM
jgi:ABC-type nitrate/sulfonate/bicarbonate transport system ATPase subunit